MMIRSCLWNFEDESYKNFVSNMLQKVECSQKNRLEFLKLMEKQMGREWIREMILAPGFESGD